MLWYLVSFGVLLQARQMVKEWHFDRQERREERDIEKQEKREQRQVEKEEHNRKWVHEKYKLEVEIAKWEAERQIQERRETRDFELAKLRLKIPIATGPNPPRRRRVN